MKQRFAFLDTNIFLHFQPLDHIDWLALLGADSVVLVIAPIVIRELNKHKDVPSSPKTRDRAAAAIKNLSAWSDTTTPITVRDSVGLQFRVNDPVLDFVAENLSWNIPDDHLVASILEFRITHPASELVLVTADLGLKLKARNHRIETVHLPDNLRLPEQLGAEEKRIRQLEAEVRRLRDRVPALKLLFSTREDRLTTLLSPPQDLTPEVKPAQIQKLRADYPKMKHTEPEAVRKALGFDFLGSITNEEVDAYNEALEKFFAKYETHLIVLQDFKNVNLRTVRLDIVAANEGTCPAEDVDIFMHFPDGFDLLREDQLTKKPAAPRAPAPPKTPAQKLEEQFRMPQFLTSDILRTDFAPKMPEFRNVSHPSIRRTKSYDVGIGVGRVKHGFVEKLDPLYVVFPSFESARSFAIDYSMHAANVPGAIEGTLHLIVNRA